MSFRTRFLLATVAILVVTVLALTVAADQWLRDSLEASLAEAMERETRLVAATLPRDTTALRGTARTLGDVVGRRVSIIDSTGRVLGDSEFDDASLALLENHADRPEVATALAGAVGIAKRRSQATDRIELKVAVRAWPGVVRLSAPIADVDAVVDGAQRAVLLAALVALLIGTLLAGAVGRALGRPLSQLASAARQVASGSPATYPASQAPEIRQLVRAFRDMQQQIVERLAALEARREESETLIDSMAEGLIAADERGDVGLCNPAARRLLGYEPDDPLPGLRELFHQREARETVERVYRGESVAGREIDLDGRTVLVTGRPLPDGGAVIGLLDVTDLKRLQAVRRDFVANVSHELKTPLTSILGYAETLLHEDTDPDTDRRFLETIRANAERMRRLVDDLLDLARLESGVWQPHPERLDLEGLVQEAWHVIGERAQGKALEFTVQIDPSVELVADADAVREILVNLFDNAVRYTPAGGRVAVHATRRAGAMDVTVRDSGSGIPAEHVPRVFERFYRVDVGRSRSEGGTGLGLSVVKHFMEAHGGTIALESEIGRGTTVRLRFPTAQLERA